MPCKPVFTDAAHTEVAVQQDWPDSLVSSIKLREKKPSESNYDERPNVDIL